MFRLAASSAGPTPASRLTARRLDVQFFGLGEIALVVPQLPQVVKTGTRSARPSPNPCL